LAKKPSKEVAELTKELKLTKKSLEELQDKIVTLKIKVETSAKREICSSCESKTIFLKEQQPALEGLIDDITKLQKENKIKMSRLKLKYG